MRRWFDALPVHRKLMTLALAVAAAALLATAAGLIVVDLLRYRTSAREDAATLSRVIAENTAAAVAFDDPNAAFETLSTVRVRPVVTKACIYDHDGQIFARYERSGGSCAPTAPAAMPSDRNVGVSTPIVYNGRQWGTVYVERDLSDVGARITVTVATAGVMLILAGALAFLLAHRLSHNISRPITELAAAARRVGENLQSDVPPIRTAPDEIGELVTAFQTMLARIRRTNDELVREIEERKKVEAEREALLVREREASRLKDEFLAAVSHELRTPLNAIMGWIQILASTNPSEQITAKALASISRNAQTQRRVIEDLVDVSRIVTGKMYLRNEPVDLRAPVEAAIEVVRPSADAKGLQLTVQAPPGPCIVNGDRDRLQQVVWNLLSNAVKFTERGGITVVTRTLESSYEIEVTDTGAGIPAAFLPHVFDRFRQADGSMTREHGGLGLGLAIVKELTEMHGGSVTVTSEGPGHGTSFRVRLPAFAGLAVDHAGDPNEPGRPGRVLQGVRVLAIDDNQDALDVIAVALEAAGAIVTVARSGPDALRAMDDRGMDVIVCDLAMPGMDGFEVLRHIREREAVRGGRTPAVAVSAHATAEHKQRSLDVGFAAHVAKPYRTGELIEAVSVALVARA